MRRTLTAMLFLALAPAAMADGQDSLLSGYGGPGDGEQALLGQTLIADDSGSSGSASAAPATPAPTSQELYAPATPAETATPTPTPTVTGNDTAGRRPSRKKPKPAQPVPARTTPSAPTSESNVLQISYGETSAPAAFDSRDLALALAILIMLGVLAACARRLAVRAARARRPSPA